MSFAAYDKEVALCAGEHVMLYNLEDRSGKFITLPKLEGEKEIRAHNKEDIESFHTLTSVAFSNDGRYIMVCVNRKQLCLYERATGELVSNRSMPRAASRVTFLPNNDIAVADKSGDAYLFSTSKPNESGQLLLGHLSMLLDILVTDDEKFVITADRDEKIRISMFPNSYNILSYCLGHKNFVTNIAIVPHDKNVLVSSGGDGSLMFWDFKIGKELLTIYFHDKLSQDDLHQLNQTLKENDLDENVTVSPVKHLKLLQIDENKSIVAVGFYCSKVILFYNILKTQNGIDVEYLNSLKLDKEPIECLYYRNLLWILTDSNVQIYKINGESHVKDETLDKRVKQLDEYWDMIHSASKRTLLPQLYKRKFDNVQEYQERKKSRLMK